MFDINSLLLIFFFASNVFAALESQIFSSIDACKFTDISSTLGLDATIYSHASTLSADYEASTFYYSAFRNGAVLGETSGIDQLSFFVDGSTSSIYGAYIDTSSFAIEMTGYFYGTLFSLDFFFFFLFFFDNY